MALHITLLEPCTATATGEVARRCAEADASLHLIGPLLFGEDDPYFREAGPADWATLDWWLHPGWRAFRDAMSRERCLYFAVDGEKDAADAPYRANSVLVFGNEDLTLPDRIREKYPDRIYRLPRAAMKGEPDLAETVAITLDFAAKRMGSPDAPKPSRGGRRRR